MLQSKDHSFVISFVLIEYGSFCYHFICVQSKGPSPIVLSFVLLSKDPSPAIISLCMYSRSCICDAGLAFREFCFTVWSHSKSGL